MPLSIEFPAQDGAVSDFQKYYAEAVERGSYIESLPVGRRRSELQIARDISAVIIAQERVASDKRLAYALEAGEFALVHCQAELIAV